MSDIVEDLMMRRADGTLFNPSGPTAADTITRLRADIINYKIGNKDLQDHCTEITSLTAEVEQNAIDLEEYRRDVEKLRAALEAICMMDISWVGDAFKLKDIARAALEET